MQSTDAVFCLGKGKAGEKPVCVGRSLLESMRGKEWGQLAWGMPVFRNLERPEAGLADRMGGLNAELEWAHVLSLGEQQRIAILRLLLHCPALAFLDEVPSSLCRSPGFPCLSMNVAQAEASQAMWTYCDSRVPRSLCMTPGSYEVTHSLHFT